MSRLDLYTCLALVVGGLVYGFPFTRIHTLGDHFKPPTKLRWNASLKHNSRRRRRVDKHNHSRGFTSEDRFLEARPGRFQRTSIENTQS